VIQAPCCWQASLRRLAHLLLEDLDHPGDHTSGRHSPTLLGTAYSLILDLESALTQVLPLTPRGLGDLWALTLMGQERVQINESAAKICQRDLTNVQKGDSHY